MKAPLVLVVGPSGVGKDTLLDGARAALAGDPTVEFVRRAITRPAAAGGEEHEAISEAEFVLRRDAGQFMLHWGAHGLHYGLPAAYDGARSAGRTVVANASRAVLDQARARLAPVRIVAIGAAPETLAQRLAERGRESADQIAARLRRMAPEPLGPDVVTVMNDDTVAAGVAALVQAIRAARTENGR